MLHNVNMIDKQVLEFEPKKSQKTTTNNKINLKGIQIKEVKQGLYTARGVVKYFEERYIYICIFNGKHDKIAEVS